MPDPAYLTYKELCAEYDSIINEAQTPAPSEDRTFFDISEYPHYENVISNWYAFFFNRAAEHSLHDLFLQSLVEIIKEYKEFSMEDCRVAREFQTDKGKFIDLVLYEQAEEDEKLESAIIIENKISAGIYNDLNDYYNSVKTKSGRKVGIVLSLHEIKNTLPKEFINITHERLLGVVRRNLGQYVASAKLKYIHYLQDFISNLEQMTGPKKMHESIKYYFEKAEKIQDLLTLRSHAYQHINNDLYRVIQADQGWEWQRNYPTYASFRKSEPDIWFGLKHRTVFETKEFTLEMWLGGKTLQAWKEKEGQNTIYSKYGDGFMIEKQIDDSRNWAYLAKKDYKDITIEDIEKFGEKILQILNDEWSELLEDVTKLLRPAS